MCIVFLFLGTCITPSIATNAVKKSIIFISDRNTLYVGGSGLGNYTKIQDAIDNTTDGDIVYVYDDSSPYEENIFVDKSISLIGENKNTTVIDGEMHASVINVIADNVYVSGFRIQNINFDRLDSGIVVWNSNNITIIDNKIWSNFFGIWFYNSSGNIITNNDISYSEIILYLQEFNNSIISDNTISHSFNWRQGIEFYNSYGNKIINNTISDHSRGLILLNSNYNVITGNIFSDNGLGLCLSDSNDNTVLNNSFYKDGIYIKDSFQNNIFGNSINDEPLVYLEGASDKLIDETAGQVILVSCNNITIKNQNFSNVWAGLILENTNNCLISDNIRLEGIGLCLYQSGYNKITNNNFTIHLLNYSCDNYIIGNTIANDSDGFTLSYFCCNNTIAGNNIINNYDGIKLYRYANGNTIIGNNISNNKRQTGYGGYGIYLEGWDYSGNDRSCDYNIIIDNYIINNYGGIFLDCANNNIIYNNFISKNTEGIRLNGRCNNNSIEDNNITFNNGSGIFLKYSSNCKNTIKNNNIISNNGDGLYIYNYMENPSVNNSIYHNNFINNIRNAYDECNNYWDNEVSGNFWDDYNGTDSNGDGIGDTPYYIFGGNNTDRYPLMKPWDNSNIPPNAPIIYGPSNGKVRVDYDYNFTLFDSNSDLIYIRVDWGNGTPGSWYGPFESGTKVKLTHIWNKKGTYIIKSQSKDTFDMSDWSKLTITIPRNKTTYNLLINWLIERFPIIGRFISWIIQF